MKILIVTPHYYPEQFKITEIAEHLSKNNDVTVWTNIPDYPNRDAYKANWTTFKRRKENINGVSIERIWSTYRGKGLIALFFNYFSFFISSTFKALFNRKKYDVVLNWETSPIYAINAGNIVAKKQKIPAITYILDLWPQSLLVVKRIKSTGLIYKIVGKQSEKIYKASAAYIITSNKFTNYLNKIGIEKNKITYIPNFCETIFEKNIINSNFDIGELPKNKLKILFAGNIGKAQNFDIIISIAKEAKNNNDNRFIFVIVGDGSEKKTLINKISTNYLEEYFIIKDRTGIENMPNYYDAADAFIYTLIEDEIIQYTLPGKVSSYLAYNKPIITSCLGESYDVLSNYKGTIFINKNAPYESIKSMVDNYQTIKNNCDISFFNENFKKENVLNKIEEVLVNEIQRKRK